MADRRRIVTISPTGTVTTLEDFEDNATLYSVRDSFTVKPGERNQNQAMRARRYGGATTTFETHGNGSISWKCLVRGTTGDNVLTNVEVALAVLEQPRLDMFFEWRPDGATNSVYYEIRGPATWTPDYKWIEFLGAKSMIVDISIPVAPLAQKTSTTVTVSAGTVPRTISLGTIGGRAPALADITTTMTTTSATAPVWAVFGWTKTPTTSTLAVYQPFGLLEAELCDTLSGPWAIRSDVAYHGGEGQEITLSSAAAGAAGLTWYVDPATMQPDDFSDEIVLEIWCMYAISPGIVNPRIAVTAFNDSAVNAITYSPEWGENGRPLSKGASIDVTRQTRLGTVTVPVNPANPSVWKLSTVARWDAGSTGTFGIDYIAIVPARQRCLSPSGKAFSSSFPSFISGTAPVSKTIRSDLSAAIGTPPARDSGLGGSPIELPPGPVSLFVMLASQIPDDPTVSNVGVAASFTASTSVKVTPREFLASD